MKWIGYSLNIKKNRSQRSYINWLIRKYIYIYIFFGNLSSFKYENSWNSSSLWWLMFILIVSNNMVFVFPLFKLRYRTSQTIQKSWSFGCKDQCSIDKAMPMFSKLSFWHWIMVQVKQSFFGKNSFQSYIKCQNKNSSCNSMPTNMLPTSGAPFNTINRLWSW